MQENEFESRVKILMDELSFDPRDAVWSGVAAEIEKDKKRRRPLFWIFVIAAPLLLGTGYLLKTGMSSGKIAGRNLPVNAAAANGSSNPDTGKVVFDRPNSAGTGSMVTEKTKPRKNPLQTDQSNRRNAQVRIRNKADEETIHTPITDMPQEPLQSGVESGNLEHPETIPGSEKASEVAAGLTVTTKVSASAQSSGNARDTTAAKKTVQEKKQDPSWTVGITGSAGVSGIYQSPAGAGGYTYNNAANSGGGPLQYVSAPEPPQAGFAFTMGVFVQRHLSPRFSVSGGLNYVYMSAKNQVGNQVSNSGSSYLSLPNTTGTYYTNKTGDYYNNRLQYLALPLLADVTLNKSKKIPLVWEAGLSFAYLIHSDYLYFDPAHQVYYQNSAAMNKDQWNLSTALLIGWNLNKGRVLMGPQYQYGISGVLNHQTSYSQHLYSLGLKIAFIPGRK